MPPEEPQALPSMPRPTAAPPSGELREKEAFNFSLFQHSPIPTTVVDAQGCVLRSNLARRASALPLPPLGEPLFGAGSGPYPACLQEALRECIGTGARRTFEAVWIADRAVRIHMSPEPREGGALVVFEDVISRPEAFRGIVTTDPTMLNLFRYVVAVAPTERPVLITGETGVGKELIARAIHELSGRKGQFVAINIAGQDDTMFSDTLFGHCKGAFTTAVSAREGLIERAAGGTLFLDEIGDLAAASQVKLLRLLQERQYLPIGADDPRQTTARVLVATNRSEETLLQADDFREDLYFRLRAHHAHVPALRERLDDLPLLLDHFLSRAADENRRERPAYSAELVPLLRAYHFPGNVRELQNMVHDAVVTHREGLLSLESFRSAMRAARSKPPPDVRPPETAAAFAVSRDLPLPTLAEAEEQLIAEALRRTNNNQTMAANLLGITRQTIYRHQKRKPAQPSP
jgi:DNA-binding NtrC family response regulator